MDRFLAHIAEDGREQTVLEHLEGTAVLAEHFAAAFGAGELGRQAGLAHDIGKYSAGFQRRLQGGPKVDHSTAGAIELAKQDCLPGAFAVAGHHGGLPNGGNYSADGPDDATLCGRLKRVPGSSRLPDYAPWREELSLSPAPLPPYCGKNMVSDAFFTRMLYSALVDADYLDTERFMSGGEPDRGGYDPLPVLLERLQQYVAPWWGSEKPLNMRRCKILRACMEGGEQPQGLYTLTVPTGGGKTISSLAFALSHAVKYGLKRVIYVIPYTSIIEQNAGIFREAVGADNVIEHHSGVRYEVDEDGAYTPEDYRKALATENWDAPIIVTTAVQFFDSLYANRSSSCRKLHNIAQSVVIFDEAQMLPIPYLRPCVSAIGQLVKNYGVTAVLCTATQPALGPLFHELAPGLPIRELCPDWRNMYDQFRRVTLRHVGRLTDEELAGHLNSHTQALCIVNSRAQAQQLFGLLEREGSFHLSTLMCPAHRKAMLKDIRNRLKEGLPCRVVSTSLIEAGVDVDFPTVYRAEAGLDSILQAAGRCNREGKRPTEESIVHIFQSERSAPAIFGPNIGAMRTAADHFPDLASPEAVTAYFKTLITLKGAVALDQKGILDALDRGVKGSIFPFAWVAEQFKLIDTPTRTVYISYKNGEALIERLRSGERSRALFREAGQYAVSLWPKHFTALANSFDIEMLDEEVAVLRNMQLYDTNTGLSLAADEGKGLFF